MGGQSQQRKSQHAKDSPHKKHRGSTDKRPPPRPRDAPESAAPPAPPMSEQCVGSPLHAQTPTEGDARNLVQTTFGEVEPARCICNVNVERMEKRGPGMTCKYITPKTNSCTACLRAGTRATCISSDRGEGSSGTSNARNSEPSVLQRADHNRGCTCAQRDQKRLP